MGVNIENEFVIISILLLEVSSTFPEGSHWQLLANIQNDPPHYEGNVGFKSVSVGRCL